MCLISWRGFASCFIYDFVYQVISERTQCSKDFITCVRGFFYMKIIATLIPINLATLKVLNFASIKFRDFRDFWLFSRNFVPTKSLKTAKSQNWVPAKLNTWRVSDSLFPNFDEHMILIPAYRISLLIITKLECL